MVVYDEGAVKAWLSGEDGIVTIRETATVIHLMPEELIQIADAVEQYLEIESAAEYMDEVDPPG